MFKNSVKTIAHGHGSSQGGVEVDRPASGFIAKMSVVLIVALGVIWFVFEGLLWTATTQVESEFFRESDIKHAELRAGEEKMVHEYGVANQEKGLYQIPIDQAIDKLVKDGSLEIR